MVTPVITLEVNDSVFEASRVMTEKHIGSIVVTENKKPVGIVTGRDILKKVVLLRLDPTKVKLGEVMSKPLLSVDVNTSILKAIKVLKKNKIKRLPVMEDDILKGIITDKELFDAMALHTLTSFKLLLRREKLG
ncbi:hypothetical protein DRO26_01175 [Candidatus Bathyarchaeota archaeon]|nr:MAG: hypothetical protein DRO26_01175 [Candidatus Bathyarchaeota archaeon]